MKPRGLLALYGAGLDNAIFWLRPGPIVMGPSLSDYGHFRKRNEMNILIRISTLSMRPGLSPHTHPVPLTGHRATDLKSEKV